MLPHTLLQWSVSLAFWQPRLQFWCSIPAYHMLWALLIPNTLHGLFFGINTVCVNPLDYLSSGSLSLIL